AMLAGMQLVNLDKVAAFLGLNANVARAPLSAPQLLTQFIHNLHVAQNYFRQMPAHELDVLATPKRGRPVRVVGVHIFTIAQAYLDCVINGARDMAQLCTDSQKIKEGAFATSDELAHYGEDVIGRLQDWWNSLEDKSCRQIVAQDAGDI